MQHRARLMHRYCPTSTFTNQINLGGGVLLVGSDDVNDVQHETLSHRGPHLAIAVVCLVPRHLIDKDIAGLLCSRSVQLNDVTNQHIVQKHVWHFKPVILTVLLCSCSSPHWSYSRLAQSLWRVDEPSSTISAPAAGGFPLLCCAFHVSRGIKERGQSGSWET